MYQYPIPPPTYMPFDFTKPSIPASPEHGFFSPRYAVHTTTPSHRASPKGHSRKFSHEPATSTYTSPNISPHYSSAGYYTTTPRTPSHNKTDHVSSGSERVRSKIQRHFYVWLDGSDKHRSREEEPRKRTPPPQYSYSANFVDGYDFYDVPPPPYQRYTREADASFSAQVPSYSEKPRRRRTAHTSSRKSTAHERSRAYSAKALPANATEEDARHAGIPLGYSLKNWDPAEDPILLLGSVFDANSLGKWIYDWTVYHHGPATPMSEVAGDLWLLLIQIAGKMKRADECIPRVRRAENREMVEDFLESADRLMARFARLLKDCEDYMWRVARREGGCKTLKMGKSAGCEFVESMFGRDRKLHETERIMAGMRLWSARFDSNCEAILRHPTS